MLRHNKTLQHILFFEILLENHKTSRNIIIFEKPFEKLSEKLFETIEIFASFGR
jgi:hypothetical protein